MKRIEKTEMTWRALMSPEELAAFDEGKYNHQATEPLESDRISRDNRLVRLTSNTETARDNPTPEQSTQAAEYAYALEVIATIRRPCVSCGQSLPGKGEGRIAILAYERNDGHRQASLYCQYCFDAMGVELETNDWFAKLPRRDKRIWRLLGDRLTQREIAARLTNGSQRVTQQMVSDTKQRITRRIKQARQNGYGS